jgi:hypothetical protein
MSNAALARPGRKSPRLRLAARFLPGFALRLQAPPGSPMTLTHSRSSPVLAAYGRFTRIGVDGYPGWPGAVSSGHSTQQCGTP